MPQIRRGLRIDDDEEQEAPKYQKQTLEANRNRSNFQKDMDDLLFGGSMKPSVRRQQPVQQPKPPVKQQPKQIIKEQTKKSLVQQNVPEIKKTQSILVPPAPKNKVQQKISNLPPQPKPPVKGPVLENKPNQAVKISKFNDSPKNQVIVQQLAIQPKQHQQPKVQKDQIVEIQGNIYNKPIYIRKLKKIAQDFKFSSQNAQNHTAIDVVRPFQCQKNRMKKQNDVNYIDHEYPPNSYSLGYQLKDLSSEWKRHRQFVKTSVFGKYVDPNDINPGKLSSPQFLSTLSVLAQMEINIKRLIQDQKVNLNGFYLIRLNINGVWRYFTVDDKLPFSVEGESFGTQSFIDNQSELWSSLIQKAYAKAYGGYDIFKRIIPRQNYLRDLTGAPVKKYLISDNNLPDVIRNAISAGYVIMAVPKKQVQSLGLNPNNSFAVINCKSNGGLQLRNSWGTLEQRTKLTISKQGVFELSINQTKQFISYIIIAQTNNQYCSSTIQSKHKSGFYSTYSFSVNNITHGYLSVSQLDQRLFPMNAYEYSPIRIILQKKNQDQSTTYVNAGFCISRNLNVQVNLTPGNYQVFVAADWKSKEYDYYLTFYGQQKIQFKRLYTNSLPNKITQSLTKLNLQTGKRSALGHCNQYIQHHKESNLIIVTADNTSDKDYLYNQDFTKVNFNNLCILNAKNNQQIYKGLIQPEISQYKNNSNENRKWPVSIPGKQQFTWVISCSEQYNPQNFKKYGFR